jgi:hypothetical protein
MPEAEDPRHIEQARAIRVALLALKIEIAILAMLLVPLSLLMLIRGTAMGSLLGGWISFAVLGLFFVSIAKRIKIAMVLFFPYALLGLQNIFTPTFDVITLISLANTILDFAVCAALFKWLRLQAKPAPARI